MPAFAVTMISQITGTLSNMKTCVFHTCPANNMSSLHPVIKSLRMRTYALQIFLLNAIFTPSSTSKEQKREDRTEKRWKEKRTERLLYLQKMLQGKEMKIKTHPCLHVLIMNQFSLSNRSKERRTKILELPM